MTDRLEIASRIMQGMLANPEYIPHHPETNKVWSTIEEIKTFTVGEALAYADAFIASAGATTDESEMARTIKRLERRLDRVLGDISHASTWPAESVKSLQAYLHSILKNDAESSQ